MPLESPVLQRLIGDLNAAHQTLRSNLGNAKILLSHDMNTGVCVVAGSVWDDLSPNEKMFVTHVLQEEQRINTAGGATIPPVIKVEVQ
jgi:hypothetical protein